MSFFRNIRSTITRGKNSSRDASPAHHSRPGSIVSNSTATTLRRDSVDSRTDSLLNRSDTFILDSDTEDKSPPSGNSTLEKKSKKSKVLSKFSTFTKRKKTPTPEPATTVVNVLEHHPSENATNTYYKWKSDGPSTLDYYDSQSDPFNFLYEQHSSIKSMQNGGTAGSAGTGSTHTIQSGNSNHAFDSSTYRKGKIPTQLREQLSQLKTQAKPELRETEEVQPQRNHHEKEEETEAEKYKTITLNSFRKSFREKFLQNQQKAPYNPSWFVEVEPPQSEHSDTREYLQSKENRPDILVFGNEDYRPSARSPVRERKERSSNSGKRSPVKRNETFRLERPTVEPVNSSVPRTSATADGSSIRIEIKNSISPHMPSRMVPVGVAKPILSPYMQEYHHNPNAKVTAMTPSSGGKLINTDIVREKSPLRNWGKPITVTPVRYSSPARTEKGRYQTLVQIRNESNVKSTAVPTAAPLNRSRLSTRIQLGSGSPTLQKRLNTAGTRYSLATPTHHSPFHISEPLKPIVGANANRVQLRSNDGLSQGRSTKHTYFGDVQKQRSLMPSITSNAMGRRSPLGGGGGGGGVSGVNVGAYSSKLQQPQSRLAAGTGIGHFNRCEPQQQQQQQQQQQRILVSTQRRSRSPIKMPWR